MDEIYALLSITCRGKVSDKMYDRALSFTVHGTSF